VFDPSLRGQVSDLTPAFECGGQLGEL